MFGSGTIATVELDDLAAVWSAARAASADRGVADDVTVAVLVRARLWRRRGTPIPRGRLVTDAVREAIALAPAVPLGELPEREREAVALARFAGLRVDEIAEALGVDAAVVRGRLRDGLRAIADRRAPSRAHAALLTV
jgi:sigma-70-like protein